MVRVNAGVRAGAAAVALVVGAFLAYLTWGVSQFVRDGSGLGSVVVWGLRLTCLCLVASACLLPWSHRGLHVAGYVCLAVAPSTTVLIAVMSASARGAAAAIPIMTVLLSLTLVPLLVIWFGRNRVREGKSEAAARGA